MGVLDNGRNIYVPKEVMDNDVQIREMVVPLLHQAVHGKQLDALLDVINRIKANTVDLTIDSRSEDQGQTALLAATSCGWNAGVQALLSARADVCMTDYLYRTPLLVAAKRGDFRLVEQFIGANADVNASEADPDYDPDFICTTHQANMEHRTALHYAAELSNVPLAHALLKGRANPNAVETKFQTPLHLALDASSNTVFELGHGISIFGLHSNPELNGSRGSIAGPAVQSDNGVLRFPVRVEDSASEVVQLKQENLRRVTEDVVDLLVQAKADVNLGNHVQGESFTILHQVARMGDVTLTRMILGARADVNRQETKVGLSPLHVAAKGKHHDIIQLLVDANADTTLTMHSGKTAADLAAVNGASEKTCLLLGGSRVEAQAAPSGGGYASLTPAQRKEMFLE